MLAGAGTFVASLLMKLTVTPPAGAGADRVTASDVDPPKLIAALLTLTDCVGVTVTVAVVSVMFGRALAWIVAVPAETPVTGTVTLVVFAGKVTVAGTVATPGVSELKLIVMGALWADDRVRERVCVVSAVSDRVFGKKAMLTLGVTCTGRLPDNKPLAIAVMVAEPTATAVTFGCETDCVWPWLMMICRGDTVTFVVSFESSVMNTPPLGAGLAKTTVTVWNWPGPSVTLGGVKVMSLKTVTVAVASASGGALAVIFAEPTATPVTGTETLLMFAGMVTVAGTVAVPALLELRVTVRPPVGAVPDKFSVRFCVVAPLMVRLVGEKLSVAVTVTVWLAGV
jgi:hypothetical protein